MNTLLLLLFIQLCSFQNLWKSVGILVVNSSHSQHTNQSPDSRGSNKNEKAHQNTKSDAAGGHHRKDFIYDDSGIDGLGEIIDSLKNYHKPSRDNGTYPLDTDDIPDRDRESYPPIRNTFTFDHNAGAVSNRDINNYAGVYNARCPDKCLCDGTQLLCVGKNLSSVPRGISPLTTGM